MKLDEIYNTDKSIISFEVFPPKQDYEKLLKELKILKRYNPAFVSLTCGAGGKENKSFQIIKEIKSIDLNVMPHFTCITSSKKNVQDGLIRIEEMGIENILALRGDIPQDETLRHYDFNYANELVKYIKTKTKLSIGVAGYPEGHIESKNIKVDIDNLKKKIDAGASAIFTQLFFDNNKFYNFVEQVQNAGINTPIIAGIMPIINAKQIQKITSLAKISLTQEIAEMLKKNEELVEFGIEQASAQCEDLIKNGFKYLHFYTLNKSYSTSKILDNIGGLHA